MTNNQWSKDDYMDNTSEKTEWRIAKLETEMTNTATKLSNIEMIVTQLNAKIPTSLNCNIHSMRLDAFDKRIAEIETEVKSITKKIITWSAVAGCVIFILTNLVFPFVLQNLKIGTAANAAPAVVIQTNTVPFYLAK
jgi:hypothetical protein